MNILLIMPLYEDFHDIVEIKEINEWEMKKSRIKGIKKLNLTYPNGLLSIGAYVKKNADQVNIKILDLNILIGHYVEISDKYNGDICRESFWEFCFLELKDFIPDIIGISALFCSNFHDLNPLADELKKAFKNSLIVCGGHLASTCYKDIFAAGENINAVIFGEGEKPFLGLVNAATEGKTEDYLVENSSFITKIKIGENPEFVPENDLIIDLDEIPPYDLDLIIKRDVNVNYTFDLFSIVDDKPKRQFAMFTTRGCPGQCVFCASQYVHGHRVRSYSIDRIKKDILYYREKWQIDHFLFYDDHFLSNKKRAMEVMEFMIENKFPMDIANIAFFSVDKPIAKLMKKAGITTTLITIENANEDTLKNIIHKPANLERAKEAIECLKSDGIVVISNILVGLPGETKDSIEKGIQEMLNLGCNWYSIFVAAPLPGSELYEICKKNNYIEEGTDSYRMDFKKCVIRTQEFEPEYIEKKVYEMNLYINFVENYDIRIGNFTVALMMLERIILYVLDTHAFAYYYAAICAKELRLNEKYLLYKGKYEEMISKYAFWLDWSKYFDLEPLI